jgi:hypothetical protein
MFAFNHALITVFFQVAFQKLFFSREYIYTTMASEFVEWDPTWHIGDFIFGITKFHREFVPGRRGPSSPLNLGSSLVVTKRYGRNLS